MAKKPYYGIGIYSVTEEFKGYIGGQKTKELAQWVSLLHRCYSKATDFTMSPDWLHFHTFARDFVSTHHRVLGGHVSSSVAALDLNPTTHGRRGEIIVNKSFGKGIKQYGIEHTYFITESMLRLLRAIETEGKSNSVQGVTMVGNKYVAKGRDIGSSYAKKLGKYASQGRAHAMWRLHRISILEHALSDMHAVLENMRRHIVTRPLSECVTYEDFQSAQAVPHYMDGMNQIRKWISAFKVGVIAPVPMHLRDDFEEQMSLHWDEYDEALCATYYLTSGEKLTQVATRMVEKYSDQYSLKTARDMHVIFDELGECVQHSSTVCEQQDLLESLDALHLSEQVNNLTSTAFTSLEPMTFLPVDGSVEEESSYVPEDTGNIEATAELLEAWRSMPASMRTEMGYDPEVHGELAVHFADMSAEEQRKEVEAFEKKYAPDVDDFGSDAEYDDAMEAFHTMREKKFPPKFYKF